MSGDVSAWTHLRCRTLRAALSTALLVGAGCRVGNTERSASPVRVAPVRPAKPVAPRSWASARSEAASGDCVPEAQSVAIGRIVDGQLGLEFDYGVSPVFVLVDLADKHYQRTDAAVPEAAFTTVRPALPQERIERINLDGVVYDDLGFVLRVGTPRIGVVQLHVTSTAQRSVIAITNSFQSGPASAEIWATREQRRLAAFDLDDPRLSNASHVWLGDALYVVLEGWDEPGARSWLYDRHGNRLTSVIDDPRSGIATEPAWLDGDHWAFLIDRLDTVLVLDVSTGREIARHSLDALWFDSPRERHASMIGWQPEGSIVVVRLDAPTGSLAVIDRATAAVEVLRAPSCPAG